MWKIYAITCALLMQTIRVNAQNDFPHMTNSRGSDATLKSTLKSSDVYPQHDDNTQLSNRNNNNNAAINSYNTNSRDAFQNTQNLSPETLLNTQEKSANMPQQKVNTPAIYNLPSNSYSPSNLGIPIEQSFNSKLFEIMSSTAQQQNLVYSPISLQTLLGFIFIMSQGKLYEELAQVLAMPNNRTYVAKTFENILQTESLNTPPTTLIMANKLYYDYRYGPIDHTVRDLAINSFGSELEQINFLSNKKAANTINSWISEKTRNLIQDIVTPSSVSSDTSALLLNSIYFKSEWLTKFASYDTETRPFFINKQQQVDVDMMYNEDVFRFGNLTDDLQAVVVEMPYKTSDLSMMLILPNDVEGLPQLESKLRFYDFEAISQKLKRETVTVRLPRFKAEFEIDMIQPLQRMGLNALFNNAGDINLFKNQQKPLKVDQFKHKSFIHVNEAGTEAAAATVAKYIPLSIPINMKYFVADHPFVFIIRDVNTTYFIGHVAQF